MLELTSSKRHFSHFFSTLIRENISIDSLSIQGVSPNYQGLKGLFRKVDGSWNLIIVLKTPEGLTDMQKVIFKVFEEEKCRIQLLLALKAYKQTKYGSELVHKFEDIATTDDMPLQGALAYYQPLRGLIQKDIYLLGQMLKDLLNVEVGIALETESVYAKGSKLRKIVLGDQLLIGGMKRPTQQTIRCIFYPQSVEESLLFFLGGKYCRFLHQFVFPEFVKARFYPTIKVEPLYMGAVTIDNQVYLEIHQINL